MGCLENRRKCVIGIAIFCIVITTISAVHFAPNVSDKLLKLEMEFYGNHPKTILYVKIVIYCIILLCYTSCLIGAIRRKSLLLIPSIILNTLLIVAAVIGAGVFLYYGAIAHFFEQNAVLLVFSAILYVCHWTFVYFLYATIKLYIDFAAVVNIEIGLGMQQVYCKN